MSEPENQSTVALPDSLKRQFAALERRLWKVETATAVCLSLLGLMGSYAILFFTDRFWDDGMVRVTGRELNGVMASPCSKGGDFSCLSCHAMHPEKTDAASIAAWRDHQMKPGMRGNARFLVDSRTAWQWACRYFLETFRFRV